MTDTAANNTNSNHPNHERPEGEETEAGFESQSSADESSLPPEEGQPSPSQKLEGEVAEWKSKASYLAAELENIKKRFARDRIDLIRNAHQDVVQKILPVVDNLERAVRATKDAEAHVEKAIREHPLFSNLLKGIDMTLKHFEQTLEQLGVQALKSLGQDFDPTRHEAISQTENPEHNDNKVVGEMQRGYTLHGRVIRPAQVVVNKLKN